MKWVKYGVNAERGTGFYLGRIFADGLNCFGNWLQIFEIYFVTFL